GTAYLGLLRCANDEETLERLLGTALEAASERGCTRLIGPVGVIPAWESGALANQFHVLPPLHTPYNPPYLPDLLASVMAPVQETALYELPARPGEGSPAGPAKLEPLTLSHVDASLAPLVAAALTPHAGVDDVAGHEVEVLRKWIGAWPAAGWLAKVDGEAVGFVLAQPDTAALMHRARGGRRLPLRLYSLWARRRPPTHGRLLLGAVAPLWRRRGIGAQLLHQVLRHAQEERGTGLACGPYAPDSAA
ncbi:MAG: GNAT family N-acetyltransferase, partial [Caldilineaceae bacterium]|nr:GNAT family N-acetyltransferase [Caldilineaceae bacterium]